MKTLYKTKMRHFNVTFQPDDKLVSIHAGATILEAAHAAGIVLNTPCGGKGTCGKCVVLLEPERTPVLACQTKVNRSLDITIPATSRFFEQKIIASGIDKEIKVHPTVIKHHIKDTPAKAEDIENLLSRQNPERTYKIADSALAKLRQFEESRTDDGFTVVCHHDPSQLETCVRDERLRCTYHIVDFEPGDTTEKMFGLAVDIGTTTVVAKLISLDDGKLLATQADFNPQAAHGDDVVSRIAFAQSDEGLGELQKLIVSCVNDLIKRLTADAGIDVRYIYEMVVVGNTTMNHIFLHLPVVQLGRAPYKAHSLEAYNIPAANLNMKINPAANIHTVENIAGFVGSDTTAAALATAVNLAEELTLIVDIGTNGELVCGNKDRLFAASCAAGPALEGARISQGGRAVSGAIEAVFINDGGDDIDIDLIGQEPPSSICGSGLIDAVAVMLDLNLLDSTGRIITTDECKSTLPPAIKKRLITKDAQPAFVLAYKKDGSPAVILTQKDIRELQLAKAAIAAGIKMLLRKLDLEESDIQQVLLAGAFGNYVRRSSALRIGLLPKIAPEKIHFVGNAACSGARMILLDRHARALAGRLARRIKYIEIAHEPGFVDVYTEAMTF